MPYIVVYECLNTGQERWWTYMLLETAVDMQQWAEYTQGYAARVIDCLAPATEINLGV
jgi:hypothetical protein